MRAYEYLPNEYDYPHTLDAQDPNMLDPLSGPVLRAAFRVMEHAHRNPDGTPSSRRKIDPTIRYTTHTVLVYRLLAAMGETDPIILAAALLHDALEDCKPEFSENPQAMRDRLTKELMLEGFGKQEADTIADEIVTICAQVKNADIRKIHKANAQMMEVPFMGHTAKILKIADQTASMYCHLLMPDERSRKKYDAAAFAHKAHNLVRKIVHHRTAIEDGEARPTTLMEKRELARWDYLFSEVYRLNAQLLNAKTPKTEAIARERFKQRQAYMIQNALLYQNPVVRGLRMDDDGVERTIDLPKTLGSDLTTEDGLLPPEQCGVTSVSVNAKGEVMRFTMWAAPEASTSHPRNLTLKFLMESIAARPVGLLHIDDSQLQSVVLNADENDEVQVHHGQRLVFHMKDDGQTEAFVNEGQRFIFDKPMPMEDFLALALHASAITDAEAQRVRSIAKPNYMNLIRAQYVEELGSRDTLGR